MSRPADRMATVRALYDVVEHHAFADFRPPDLARAAGAIDLHVHAGPGRQDPSALARHASRAGMRALVLKNPFLGSTCELARQANRDLAGWVAAERLTPVEVVGSVVCGQAVGGIRPDDVAGWVARGAGVVWLPVLDAANHLHRAKDLDVGEARRRGLSVLSADDSLVPEVVELLHLVAESDVALSFGHLSSGEMLALAEACARLGITRAFVDHPLSPVANLSLDEMALLASHGVTCNFTYWELSPYCGVTASEMVEAIRRVGARHATVSSDAGMEIFPDSVECLRLHDAMLDVFGFDEGERDLLVRGNAARILGLSPPPPTVPGR